MSPLEAVVDVGLHAAAIAGMGIETNSPEIRVVAKRVASFGRA